MPSRRSASTSTSASLPRRSRRTDAAREAGGIIAWETPHFRVLQDRRGNRACICWAEGRNEGPHRAVDAEPVSEEQAAPEEAWLRPSLLAAPVAGLLKIIRKVVDLEELVLDEAGPARAAGNRFAETGAVISCRTTTSRQSPAAHQVRRLSAIPTGDRDQAEHYGAW